jgi:hypothetical protein
VCQLAQNYKPEGKELKVLRSRDGILINKKNTFLVYVEHKFMLRAKAFLWSKNTHIAVDIRNVVGLKATKMQEKSQCRNIKQTPLK